MKRNAATILGAISILAVMILDSKTALSGAADGVQLCIATVIPSLFPFFVVSVYLTGQLGGRRYRALAPLERLLSLPQGSAALPLIGFLGGYPVGAQCIAAAFERGELSRADAERMLGFCVNAGPAFFFGIGATLFHDTQLCLLLWAIHVISALFVGFFTRERSDRTFMQPSTQTSPTLREAMLSSLHAMALVCGWIVAFRTLIAFFERWFLWLLPRNLQLLLIGLTELSNGCCSLREISSVGLRMALFSLFIGFGGVCVTLQTRSVVGTLSLRRYFPGKVAQAALSFLLCILLLPMLHESYIVPLWSIATACAALLASLFFLLRTKNSSSNLRCVGV